MLGSLGFMFNRRRIGLPMGLALLVIVSVSAFAQKKDEKKQTDEQKRELQALVKTVDDVAAGQPATNDLNIAWEHEDYLKAQGNKEYAPFSVTFDPTKITGATAAFYWRVVSKNAPPPPAAPDPKDKDKKDDKKNVKRPEYAYEDITYVPVAGQTAPMRVQRSFTVPAGAYDVYVAVKEPTSTQKNAPPA